MADAPVFQKLTREERRIDLLRLYKELSEAKHECRTCVRGVRCREPHAKPYKTMAWVFSVRESTIIQEVEACRAEWRKQTLVHVDEHEQQVLRNLEWVQAEAQAEWERSKLPFTQTTTESSTDSVGLESGADRPRGRRARAQKLLREQCGDPRYLATILNVQAQRREIWGLDAPKKVIPLNPDGTGVFETLLRTVARVAAQQVIDLPVTEYKRLAQVAVDSDNGAGEYVDVADVPV